MPKKKSTQSSGKHSTGKLAIAIMAAGKGTRLKSKHPKVLHAIAGKGLLEHVVAAATQVVPAEHVYAIVGHEADRVREALAPTGINFVLQAEQRGTGHAIMTARDALKGYENVIVLSGDAPLIRQETIKRLRDFHARQKAAMTVLTAEPADPRGYGRIIRVMKGNRVTDDVGAIVEQKALTAQQAKLREINSGIYCFAVKPLFANIDRLTTDNAHREFYLTDMAAILAKTKQRVVAMRGDDANEVLGINTRLELAQLDAWLRARKCSELMSEGVTMYRPDTCMIDADVRVAADTIIEPFVQLLGKTTIGADCRVRSYSVISNSEIGDGVLVRMGCVIDGSRIENDAKIGPYTHIRPDSNIGEGAHVGNFVELKKTTLGRRSKSNHLTYLGDALIGDDVNIGAGTITCNYDGVEKHNTAIDDGAFIGSDTTLVAPVRVGRGAYVGAASCITENVPPDSLAIGRARQVVKEDWARQKRERQKK